MPTVDQIDPIHTPEKFFLKRNTGEKDDLGEVIYAYDLVNEQIEYAEGVCYKRKSEHGDQDLHVYNDRYKAYENGELVAEAQVILEFLESGKWQAVKFEKTPPTDLSLSAKTQDIEKESVLGDAILNIKFDWKGGKNQSAKTIFYASYPGKTIRIKWIITIHNSQHLVIDYSDYKGKPSDDLGLETRTIVFEPEGVKDELLVDPYLSVDEQASYIEVLCDGFEWRFYNNDQYVGEFAAIWQSGTERERLINEWGVTDPYGVGRDTARVVKLIEDTPTRVTVRITGNYYNSGYLANSTGFTISCYCYADRMAVDIEWITTDTITLDAPGSESSWIKMQQVSLANEDNICEDSGSEIVDVRYVYKNSADYFGFVADELNTIVIMLAESITGGTAGYLQRGEGDGVFWCGRGIAGSTSTITSGTHHFAGMVIVDSATRAGSAKKYDSVDRLLMGDQYKDLEI